MTCNECKRLRTLLDDADAAIDSLRKTVRDQEHEIVRLRIKLQQAESKTVMAVGREA